MLQTEPLAGTSLEKRAPFNPREVHAPEQTLETGVRAEHIESRINLQFILIILRTLDRMRRDFGGRDPITQLQTGNGAPGGPHYELGIIGVTDPKTQPLTGSNRLRIFVGLGTNKRAAT